MDAELEDILEQADELKISLSIIEGINGMESGKYLPLEKEILLNPCQSQQELGITFMREMYHHVIYIKSIILNPFYEEDNAEKYAQLMYAVHPEEIDEYLIERGLL